MDFLKIMFCGRISILGKILCFEKSLEEHNKKKFICAKKQPLHSVGDNDSLSMNQKRHKSTDIFTYFLIFFNRICREQNYVTVFTQQIAQFYYLFLRKTYF